MRKIQHFAFTLLPLTMILGSCYVIPMDQYGNPVYPVPTNTREPSVVSPTTPKKTGPITISARLYPSNELAAESGIVSGSVTNMLTGKGRFNLSYKGETYSGEATRVSDKSRSGVASAFSPSGGYMSCEYQMNTPRQGAGTCLFSNGAEYKLHLGD